MTDKKVSLYDVIDDFTRCNEFENCEDCKAFTKISELDDAVTGAMTVDFCEVLRTYKGMLVESLYKEIDKL